MTILPAPQGETVEEAMERVKAALKPLIRRHHEESFRFHGRWRAPGSIDFLLLVRGHSPSLTNNYPAVVCNALTSRESPANGFS